MSNFQLSPIVRQFLINATDSLIDRYCTAAAQAFPLSVTEIQRTVFPDETVECAREVERRGIEVEKYNMIVASVEVTEPYKRWVTIKIEISNYGFYLPYRNWMYASGKNRRYFSVDRLSPDLQEEFYGWVKRALLARQLGTLTAATIAMFINHHAPTMYHLLARWPALAILPEYLLDRRDRDLWTKRFHSAPPVDRLGRWGWDYTKPEDYTWRQYDKRMKLSEMVLAAATVLPVNPPVPEIGASAIDWQKLEWERY